MFWFLDFPTLPSVSSTYVNCLTTACYWHCETFDLWILGYRINLNWLLELSLDSHQYERQGITNSTRQVIIYLKRRWYLLRGAHGWSIPLNKGTYLPFSYRKPCLNILYGNRLVPIFSIERIIPPLWIMASDVLLIACTSSGYDTIPTLC